MTRPAGLSNVEFKILPLFPKEEEGTKPLSPPLAKGGQGGFRNTQNGTVGLNLFLHGHKDVEIIRCAKP
jgi:hypothetical protein